MVIAHFVPTGLPPAPGVSRWAVLPALLVHGRAATLFVVLAGFSLAWHAGERPGAPLSEPTQRSIARVATLSRTPVLWLAGLALLADRPSPVYVIIHVYAALSVIGAVALDWPTTRRLAVAAGLLGVWPLLLLARPGIPTAVARLDAGWPEIVPHFSTMLVTGAYPVLPWAGFYLVGMALASLPALLRPARLAIAALAAGAITHLVSALAGRRDAHELLVDLGFGSTSPNGTVRLSTFDPQARLLRFPPTWLGQLSAEGHRTSIVGYVSCLSFAVGMLALCHLVEPQLRRFGGPLLALGRAALSAYVLHVLLLGRRWLSTEPPMALFNALATVAALAAILSVWLAFVPYGPLELVARAGARATRAALLPKALRRRQ